MTDCTHYTFIRDWNDDQDTRDPAVMVVALDHTKGDPYEDAEERAWNVAAESWRMTAEEFVHQTRHVLVAFMDITGYVEIETMTVPLGAGLAATVQEDEEEGTEHEDGDGCAIYDRGYQVYRQGEGAVDVEDLEAGDLYRDDAYEDEDEWLDVEEVAVVGDDVHVRSSGLRYDDDGEVDA